MGNGRRHFTKARAGALCFAAAAILAAVHPARAQPVIVQEPQSQSVPPRTVVTLAVQAVSDTPVRYRWVRNGRVLPIRRPTFRFIATRLRAGTYQAIARDGTGQQVTSTPATVAVKLPPVILVQPKDTVVKEHDTAVFEAVLNNSGPYTTIVWHNDNPREGPHQIPDGIGIDPHKPRLEIPNSLNVDYYNGIYWLAVTNEVGGTVSKKVVLTVVP